MDQVPVDHQADLDGVGGEGQQVRESTDCKVTGRVSPPRPQPAGSWLRRCRAGLAFTLPPPQSSNRPVPLAASLLPSRAVSPNSKGAVTPNAAPPELPSFCAVSVSRRTPFPPAILYPDLRRLPARALRDAPLPSQPPLTAPPAPSTALPPSSPHPVRYSASRVCLAGAASYSLALTVPLGYEGFAELFVIGRPSFLTSVL